MLLHRTYTPDVSAVQLNNYPHKPTHIRSKITAGRME